MPSLLSWITSCPVRRVATRLGTIRFAAAWLFVVTLVPIPVEAQQWGRFRGPNGAGVAASRAGVEPLSLPDQWTEDQVLWRRELPGIGHSSPVVGGGPDGDERMFLTSGDEQTGDRFVLALDSASGETLWRHRVEGPKHSKHKLNSFASPTPVIDQQFVYVAWGTPEMVKVECLTYNGEPRWSRELGAFRGGHGFGVSPILVEDLLVLPLEHGGPSRLIALDRKTGAIRWEVERESSVHYATPCLYTPESDGSKRQLIFTNWEQGITGVDPTTGKTLWAADVFDQSHLECSIGSPIVFKDLVIGTCGYLGHGNETIAVRPRESGSAELVYRIARGAPLCTTPVVAEGLLLLWADNGIVTCADAETGEVHWQKRVGGNFYASPIYVDGKFLNIDVDGNVIQLAADDQYKLLGKYPLGEGSHSSPAIAGGRLYLRTFSQLVAIRGSE